MIPQDAAFKQILWILREGGQVWLLRLGSKMKGLADMLRDPWSVAVKECQPRVHFQSIKN